MKTMKKLASLLLALAMIFALATTAFAEDSNIYEIYQIFTGDVSNGVLSNVKWGANGTGTPTANVNSETLDALADVKNGSYEEKMEVIKDLVNLESTPIETGSTNSYNLDNGYYLVKNVDGSMEGEGEFYTLYVVEVVSGTLTITPKGDAPTIDKVVDDNDVNIGDTVTFTLTATMPNTVVGYDTYSIVFHDTLSAGLTYSENSATVTVDGTERTAQFTVTENNGNLEIFCNDVLAQTVGAKASSKIVVTYNAVLNENAVIGVEGNPNKVKLEYSNNPNVGGTGETVEKEVKVYSWDMEVLKFANGVEADVLEGVKFILLNEEKNKVAKVEDGKFAGWDNYTENTTAVATYELITDANGKIEIDGLESGTYYLRETKELPGYNKLAGDITVMVDNNEDNAYATFIAKVNNNSGTELPSTGGMGTTLFYVLGGILFTAAVVLLVTKKRMAN